MVDTQKTKQESGYPDHDYRRYAQVEHQSDTNFLPYWATSLSKIVTLHSLESIFEKASLMILDVAVGRHRFLSAVDLIMR